MTDDRSSSEIHPAAEIGAGARIGARVHVRELARIGAGTRVADGAYIDRSVSVGEGCDIGEQVSIYQGVSIGPDVRIAAHVVFTNDRYPRAGNADWSLVPTRVERGARIGANSTVVCGVTVGSGALVEPGSVVTRDVAPGSRVGGNPARPRGQRQAGAR